MTQWEEMKKEYCDIPIPADGALKLLETIEKAKQQREEAAKQKQCRIRAFTKYATIAAAVFVVVLLVPGIMLFSGGFGATAEDAAMSMKPEQSYHTAGSTSNWYVKNESADSSTAVPEVESSSMEDSMDNAGNSFWETPEGAYEYATDSVETGAEKETVTQEASVEVFSPEVREAISREILGQMEKRMQAADGTYYIKSETYPQGFEQITERQEHYINAEGLLVIIFSEGTVAPVEQGRVEFVIPATVFQP